MIGIVYIQDILNCPFLSKYTRTLDNSGIEYKVIYWNRKANETKTTTTRSGKIVEFRLNQNVSISKIRKIKGFLQYKLFLDKEIKDCDRLILLTTLSGMILVDKIQKYKNKYIFDFRDPSFEKYSIFSRLIEKIIADSYFTCISSEAFEKILPPNDYYLAHNFRYEDIHMSRSTSLFKKKEGPINIVYFGAIREYQHIKLQMELFANDSRFELFYYGDGSDYTEVLNYYMKMNYANIHMMGKYDNDNKPLIIQIVDIINNHYPLSNNYDISTSNKYYDSLIYKRPLLSNKRCIDGLNSSKHKTGIQLDLLEKRDLDTLYSWYMDLDEKVFNSNCSSALDEIVATDDKYLKKIVEFGNL